MLRAERAIELEKEGFEDGIAAYLSGCSNEVRKPIVIEDEYLKSRYDIGFNNGYTKLS